MNLLKAKSPLTCNFNTINLRKISTTQISNQWKKVFYITLSNEFNKTEDLRWQEGYYPHNRPADERGFDLNRWTWERKRKYWQKPITSLHLVAGLASVSKKCSDGRLAY